MSGNRARWERLYREFDPERPADTPALRADRAYSPARDIDQALKRPFGPVRALFAGSVGTGKTTELLRIADAQRERRFVVFLDLGRHFSEVVRDGQAIQNVHPWEVLLLVALAVWRGARELLGRAGGADDEALARAIERLAGGSSDGDGAPTVNVASLAGALALVVGGAAGGTAAAVGGALSQLAAAGDWTLRIGLRDRPRLPDQDPGIQALLAATNRLILATQQAYRPLLVVIDGLDRIVEPTTVRGLFVDSRLLCDLECSVVVTAPISIPRPLVRVFDVYDLPNVPVLLQAAPPAPGPGLAFFHDAWTRRLRVAGIDEPMLSEAQVSRLAWACGGQARLFMRLVREVAERGWDQDLPAATDAVIEDAVDERRRLQERGLTRGSIDLLQRVADDPEHRLPDGPEVLPLLEQHHLLAFPNRTTWYFPHPLLTLELVKIRPGSGGSSASST